MVMPEHQDEDFPNYDDDEVSAPGCSVLVSRDEAKDLAEAIKSAAPSYTAIAETLMEMSRGEIGILAIQLLGPLTNEEENDDQVSL